MHNYESSLRVFPPSSTSIPGAPSPNVGVWAYPSATAPKAVSQHLQSFASLILPYMDQGNLNNAINYSQSSLDDVNRNAAQQIIPAYRCPSFDGGDYTTSTLYTNVNPAITTKFAIRNYFGMAATDTTKLSLSFHPTGIVPDGVIYPGKSTKIRDITDGTSNTLMVAESKEQDASVWIDGSTASFVSTWFDASKCGPPTYDCAGTTSSINRKNYSITSVLGVSTMDSIWGPSSQHTGGAQHLLCDGSVRMLSENLSLAVYDSLTTRNNGDVVGEF